MRVDYREIRAGYQDCLFFLKEQNIQRDLHPQQAKKITRQPVRRQKKNPFDNIRPF